MATRPVQQERSFLGLRPWSQFCAVFLVAVVLDVIVSSFWVGSWRSVAVSKMAQSIGLGRFALYAPIVWLYVPTFVLMSSLGAVLGAKRKHDGILVAFLIALAVWLTKFVFAMSIPRDPSHRFSMLLFAFNFHGVPLATLSAWIARRVTQRSRPTPPAPKVACTS